jgi:hypothetical protein
MQPDNTVISITTGRPVDPTTSVSMTLDYSEEPLRGGPRPPDNGNMEARVLKLEALAEKTGERLTGIDLGLVKIEGKQDEFSKYYATKADVESVKTSVSEAKYSIIVWVVGAILFTQVLPALPGVLRALGLIK